MNILDSLKNLASDELLSGAANALGEDKGAISKAMGGILPTILSGIMKTDNSNQSALSGIFSQVAGNSNLVGDLLGGFSNSNAPSNGIGQSLLSSIFGDKLSGIVNLISNFSGIKAGSSSSLLGMGGTLLASFLGKKMIGEGLNFGGIMDWLGKSKHEIVGAAPAGISDMLGFSSGKTETASHVSSTVSSASSRVGNTIESTTSNFNNNEDKGTGMKWLLPALILVALGLLAWKFLPGCNKDEAAATAEHGTEVVANAAENTTNTVVAAAKGMVNEAGDWVAEKGEAVSLKLSNGTEIATTKGSFEDKLLAFINDPSAKADKNKPENWFNFEDLLFETGKSSLKPGSENQLKNACEILKAYPNVKIKLGGYTDNTGDSTANVKLSDSRAKTVHQRMLNAGVTAASFDTEKAFEGYGSLYPAASNDTKEGRAQNRRISAVVIAK